MKRALLGFLMVVVIAMATIAIAQQRGEVVAQRAAPTASTAAAAAGTELIVVPTLLGEKGQMLTVIDPRLRVLSVYHIDLATGKITLKSVRNIHWDLQTTDFNNESPSPKEIRSWLEQK